MAVKARARKGAYWIFVDHNGRRKAKRVGKGRKVQMLAEKGAVKIQARLLEGDCSIFDPPPTPEPVTLSVPTFDAYAERWLTECIKPHRKPRTEDYYRQIVSNHLMPAFGPIPLTDLKPARVRGFIADKLAGRACAEHSGAPAASCDACQAPLGRNTVKNIAATLRAIFYQAQQVDELVTSNPAARFGKFFEAGRDASEHVVALEPDAVSQLLTTAAKWYPEHELAVRVLFFTGMREGELLGLQWDDIDWRRDLIDLRRTVGVRRGRLIVNVPKSGKLRTIDIPATLTLALRERRS